MPFFLRNFPEKLSINPMRMTAVPPIVCKIAFNDIRVRRAMFLRKRYARRPKLGKSTLLLRHAIKHLEFRLVMQSKIREYYLQDAGNSVGTSTKIHYIFQGIYQQTRLMFMFYFYEKWPCF